MKPSPPARVTDRTDLLAVVAIFAAVLIAYWPALRGELLWDDAGHVTAPELRSLHGLARIWFEPGATQQYYPLLHTAFWIEHRIWGDATLGYHLVNVFLHALTACLLAKLLRRLAVPGAWFAAALFALHPVGVESVAWISEQKNTLSTVFYLVAALAYLRFEDTRARRWYALASVRFILALLTKSVTATLPAALLVIQWWRRGRIEWRRDVQPLLPWFGLAAFAGLATTAFEHSHIGAEGADFSLSTMERVLIAGRAVWFYLAKLLWPERLIFIYPRWHLDAGEAWQWLFPLGALVGLGVLWWKRQRHRGWLAAALLFVGSLFPALGFVNVFPFIYSFVADHFQYLASLSVFAFVAASAATLSTRLPQAATRTGAALVLALLGALTWRQAAMYQSPFTLYETTLALNPACWMAHNNLGIALVDAGRIADALPHYERALVERPNTPEAENNYGYALTQVGRPADAIPHLQRALSLQNRYAEAENNLGAALMNVGRTEEGIAAFAKAAEWKPGDAMAHFNHGLALASHGHPAAAISDFQRALKIDPNYADAELNWAIALTVTDHVLEALPHFERAIALRPEIASSHNAFGRALASAGRFDAALAQFREALELQPNYAEAHFNLALALRQTGHLDEASAHYEEARRLGWKN